MVVSGLASGEDFGESRSSSGESGADRSYRNAQDCRGFVIGKPEDANDHQHFRLGRWKLTEQPNSVSGRIRRNRRCGFTERGEVDDQRAARHRDPMIGNDTTTDAKQPSFEGAMTIERVEIAPSSHERVLDGVIGGGAIATQRSCEQHQRGAVHPNQLIESPIIHLGSLTAPQASSDREVMETDFLAGGNFSARSTVYST